MSNKFASLKSDSSDPGSSSESDVEEIIVGVAPSFKQQHSDIPRQSGGTFVERHDAITGVSLGAGADPTQLGFDDVDVEAAIRVVTAVGKNMHLFKLPQLKQLRAALHPLIMEQSKNYDFKNPEGTSGAGEVGGGKSKRNRQGKRKAKDANVLGELQRLQKKKLVELEEEYINQTQLRALRLKQLEKLNDEGAVPRVPDGVAICDGPASTGFVPMLTAGTSSYPATVAARQIGDGTAQPTLLKPLSCYICHKPYVHLHFFYHQLCPDCAAFNYGKREEMADLRGKVILVTGGRTKIGYRSVLKLLRCGARVVATTRFPRDAAGRYVEEADSARWIHNLDIYGLDFRNLGRLEEFCTYLMATYDRLDAIVNNAAQTVRRPPAYFSHLIEGEKRYAQQWRLLHDTPADDDKRSGEKKTQQQQQQQRGTAATGGAAAAAAAAAASSPVDKILQNQHTFAATGHGEASKSALLIGNHSVVEEGSSSLAASVPEEQRQLVSATAASSLSSGIVSLSSAEMSQIIIAPGDESTTEEQFPAGMLDVNRQQVDLRNHNSWTMKLHEVSTPELAEVMAINTMAPTILNSRLKPMMERHMDDMKFIVNVSAMEGKFYRFKSDAHPHTNMAKAALNMMTRTSAQDYVKSNIYMTSVDTGWINDEKPIEKAVAHEKKHKFQTPLDEIDAASRVLDPIIAPFHAKDNGGVVEPAFGVFLKDYMKCEW